MPSRSKWQSLPTEQINPATLAIDKLSPADIVEGMLNEDRKMLAAVQREKDRIAVGVEIITQALRRNGRIIFVGAGTTGRLGGLESAEMPPTFGTNPDLGQTQGALRVDVERGAERRKGRARRIITIVAGVDYGASDELHKRAHWDGNAAIGLQKSVLSYPKSLSRLRKPHDFGRDAIGE